MRILITGSHGFVGINLIEVLSRQHEIIQWNVREDKPLPEVDVVIHLAGLVDDTKHTYKKEAYYQVNTTLTQQIYDRFLDSNAKKFIFFSSIKAQDGDTPYALSKKKAEEYILKMEDGKNVYVLRPCMIHGKGNKGNLNLLYKAVKLGFPWPLAAFENKRSFASIDNVCYIVLELLNKNVESGIYNICDDDPISTNELISIIYDCLGKKARLWRIPKGLITGIARLGNVLHLPLNMERLQKLTEDYIVDNTKIKQALGIVEMPIKTIDGLKTTINFMVKNDDCD